MAQRPPTIQQGAVQGKKRINTKPVSTSLPPHCLPFAFFFEKSKKPLCHSHFRALRNAIATEEGKKQHYGKYLLQDAQLHQYIILIHLACQHKQACATATLCCISHASLAIPVFLLPSAFPSSTTCANPVTREAQQDKPVCNILGQWLWPRQSSTRGC